MNTNRSLHTVNSIIIIATHMLCRSSVHISACCASTPVWQPTTRHRVGVSTCTADVAESAITSKFAIPGKLVKLPAHLYSGLSLLPTCAHCSRPGPLPGPRGTCLTCVVQCLAGLAPSFPRDVLSEETH